MLTPEEFRKGWTPFGLLSNFDSSIAQTMTLPVGAIEFLTNAGLPPRIDYPLNITRLFPLLPLLEEIHESPEFLILDGKQLCVFAAWYRKGNFLSYYCLDLPGGEVYVVDALIPKHILPRFANSSIQQFAEFLLIMKRALALIEARIADTPHQEFEEIDNAITAEIAAQTLRALCLSDPAACAEAENYLQTGSFFGDLEIPTREWTMAVLNLEWNRWF